MWREPLRASFEGPLGYVWFTAFLKAPPLIVWANYVADLQGFAADLGAFVTGLEGVAADFGGTAVCESRASLLRHAKALGDGGLNGRGSNLALLALRSTCEQNITHPGKG
jgi:hypothetical protein